MNDLEYLFEVHAVGLCPEERCVTARERLAALVEAAVRLRAAAVKAGAHIVVTTDYPDGVKAFGVLCDAIDAMDAALEGVASREGSGT